MTKMDLFKTDYFAKTDRVLVGKFRILPFSLFLTKSGVLVVSQWWCLKVVVFTVLEVPGFLMAFSKFSKITEENPENSDFTGFLQNVTDRPDTCESDQNVIFY